MLDLTFMSMARKPIMVLLLHQKSPSPYVGKVCRLFIMMTLIMIHKHAILKWNMSNSSLDAYILPNGNPVMVDGDLSEKFRYKLNWMDRLNQHAASLNLLNRPVILAGDYNIIPDAKDCHDIKAWQGDALHHPDSLKRWRHLLYSGYMDAWRVFHPATEAYSFWDYQGGAWQKDHGIRIDHFMLNAEAADRLLNANIDKTPRGKDRASDHTPVLCQFYHDIPPASV